MADAETIDQTRTAKLQVANARPDDSGHGLARQPKGAMQLLGVVDGDVVEIVSVSETPWKSRYQTTAQPP